MMIEIVSVVMDALFRTLDDRTRRRMVELLQEGELSAGALAAAFFLGRPTSSHYLNLLRKAGLVSSRKVGATVVYRLEPTVVQECLTWCLHFLRRPKRRARVYEKTPANTPRLA